MNVRALIGGTATIFLGIPLMLVSPTLAQREPSLRELQQRALDSTSRQEEQRQQQGAMESRLDHKLVDYVTKGMAYLERQGVKFGPTEDAFNNLRTTSRSAGLGTIYSTPVGEGDRLRLIGTVGGYPLVALASGQWLTIRPRTAWSEDGARCSYELDFSLYGNSDSATPRYDCKAFVDGRLTAEFNRAFEASVRDALKRSAH